MGNGWMNANKLDIKKKAWSYYYYNAADDNDGEHIYFFISIAHKIL